MRAMELILKLLRTQTDVEYAALHVKSINVAALGFYERMGFTCDPESGFLKNHYFIDGKYWDAYRYTKPLRNPLMAALREYCAVL